MARARWQIAPFLPWLCLGTAGCVATQRDMLQISQQTDSLTLQIHELKKSMGSLQANQADLATKLDQMHQDVSTLTETLRDSQQSTSRLSGKMDDLGAALGSKVSSLGQSLDQQKRLLETREEERKKAEAEQEAARKNEEARRASEGSSAATPSQLYHSALVQFNQKKYAMAAQGFELYLKKYPKGEVADLATYYLGQAYHAQKQWEPSAKQFALLLDRYPQSDLTASARLMYASSLIQLKSHLDEAKRYLQSIPEDFPRSPEAKRAAQLLKELETKQASQRQTPSNKQP